MNLYLILCASIPFRNTVSDLTSPLVHTHIVHIHVKRDNNVCNRSGYITAQKYLAKFEKLKDGSMNPHVTRRKNQYKYCDQVTSTVDNSQVGSRNRSVCLPVWELMRFFF